MASTSAFSLLTAGGARFDKTRFGADFDLFNGRSKRSASQSDRKGKGKAVASDSLPGQLDIFHEHPHSSRPRQEHVSTDEDDTEDGAAPVDVPEPPKQKITITGPSPLPKSLHSNLLSLVSHSSASLTSEQGQPLLSALERSNIHSLWGVQCAVSGSLLAGNDTLCIAPTGSGKTLSYLLPTLVSLRDPARSFAKEDKEGKGVRALVLVPTHDLAVQIHGVLRAITKGRHWRCLVLSKATEVAVCESAPGPHVGAPRRKPVDEEPDEGSRAEEDEEDGELDDDDESTGSVNEFAAPGPPPEGGLGIDILIATPERLHHLINEGRFSLAHTRHLILDEADRLLSPDFLPQVEPIVDACTFPSVQKCLLSATIPAGDEELARTWLREGGVRVVVGIKDSAVSTVSQSLLFTSSESGKIHALRNLIAKGELPYPSLIFVQSIDRAEQLYKQLALEDVKVDMVHGGRSKTKREEAVVRFRKGLSWVLVVTEVLARGMDFRGVKVVVNYDFPQTVQSYIHRIGRTGRAGRPGKAITFFSTEDGPYLRT